EKGMQALRDFGLKPHFSDIYGKWRYLAGVDSTRLQEFLQAMRNPAARAIFFARGGYGSGRLLRYADQFSQAFHPMIFLGCSDITSLHLYFQRAHNLVVFHGPMASGDFACDQVDFDSLRLALMQD